VLAAILVAVAVGNGRPAALAEHVAAGINSERTPQIRLGTWSSRHVRLNARILFDDEAYFDPARFPDQATNANVLRYTDLIRKQPDYFVLTDYPHAANWIGIKRLTQKFGKWNDDPYSVRLYQDLIDRSRHPYTPGPTPVRYIALVKVAGLAAADRSGEPAWFRAFDWLYRTYHPNYRGLQAALSTDHRLLLYRVDRRFYDQKTPLGVVSPEGIPISSASASGYGAANAFDGTGYVWLAKGQGLAADGAYIGVDYGDARIAVAKIRIKWVAAHWLPSRLQIQYSDDGRRWITVLTRPETAPPDQHNSPGLKRWVEEIRLPRNGKHRMWRIAADGVPPTNYFGVDELELLR